MTIIPLTLKKRENTSHEIVIENGIRKKIPEILLKKPLGNKYAIITDSHVVELYGDSLQNELKKENIASIVITIPAGEKSKKLGIVEKICEKLFEMFFDRDDCVIALGGGVVTDISGFIASIYMRGIPFIHTPTSLLAMADAAIGGKTGVNLSKGKNILGAFHQPKAVFIDPDFLKTLPKKHLCSGLAEIIKHAVIGDKNLFEFLENNIEKVLSGNLTIFSKILDASCRVKVEIVTKDEKEKKLRMLLNYGHTFGHAIEQISRYKIPHGNAVAIGMCLINKIAVKRGMLKQNDADRIKNVLKKVGLPTEIDKKISFEEIEKVSKHDKKRKDEKIYYVVPTKIGKATILADLI